MSNGMSWPLSGNPDGTTTHSKVTNACFAAEERPNKTTIFILGVRDTRSFLARLRGSALAV
jgi:hypothetical protein